MPCWTSRRTSSRASGAGPHGACRPPRNGPTTSSCSPSGPTTTHPSPTSSETSCATSTEVGTRLRVVDDGEGAAPLERHRFDHSERVDAWGDLADEALARLAEHGTDTVGIDREAAFLEVGHATIAPGELLLENGSPPAFVYVPMGEGLQVRPGGGYPPSPLHPWIPVGTTGAVRRAGRNSDVVAKQQVEVLMVPGPLYVRSWLRPVRPEHVRAQLTSKGAGT